MATTKKESTKSEKDDNFIGDLLDRFTRASAELLGGIARGTANGFDAFRDEVNEDNVTRMDSKNGIYVGTVEGLAKAFEEVPKAIRSANEILTD